MRIRIDVSDKRKFEQYYNDNVISENVDIREDNASYGINDMLIIGMTFLFEASLSGITWDYIKEQILPFIKAIFLKKRKNDDIYIYISDGQEDYNIEIPSGYYRDVEIKIPKKLELKLNK
jgi:hypothetical protein